MKKVLILSVFFPLAVFAAKPSHLNVDVNKNVSEISVGKVSVDVLRSVLNQKLPNRILSLRPHQKEASILLEKMAFDNSFSMQLRWRALTTLAALIQIESRQALFRALKEDQWFMRNAALVALESVDPSAAVNAAEDLVFDPALVVRSAAVDILSQTQSAKTSNVLWKALNDKKNFRQGTSLWIRQSIVVALESMTHKGDEGKWIQILADKDQSLHPVAIRSLEKITGKSMGQTFEPVVYKKAYWEQWWKTHSNL